MISVPLPQATHFILNKNNLTARRPSTLPQLVEDIAGLPAASPTTPYLAARARLAAFAPELLRTALSQTGGLIKSPLMRTVPYIIKSEQYPTFHAATARQRNKDFNAEFRLWGIEHNEPIETLAETILAVLGDTPLSAEAVMARLPIGAVQKLSQTSRGGRVTETTNVALALRWLAANGQLYAANALPDWRSESPVYAPLRYGYPDLDLATAPGEAEAQKVVVRHYLAAFGPATEADISFWTGFGKSETARATGALSGETTLTMVQGIPGMLLALKDQADALKSVEPPAEPVVNVLPANDPLVTAHRASRARYFGDPSLQRRVFSGSGAAKPTILVNGQVVGLWAWQRNDEAESLTWQLLTEVDPAVVPLIEAEVEQMAGFVGGAVVRQEGT